MPEALDRTNDPINPFPGNSVCTEAPSVSFEADLDAHLCYHRQFLVLTATRLAVEPAASPAGPSWNLATGMSVAAVANTGAGQLELREAQRLLACWHYTIGRHADATAFARTCNARVAWLAAADATDAPAAPQEPDAVAPAEEHVGITSRTTFQSVARLAGFARPWWRYFIAGLILSVACTAAGLVPPYITMPLLDKVLIPFQQGKAADPNKVVFYLSALGGAAVLAWLLGWTRTFVIAWVSERVSAGLRNTIYSHFQRLSLDYFSDKRTGDLISRVSTDTDRICFFLSVYMLDFASDILMITMTAGILFYINPTLALVTLCPFPIIAWITYHVRQILRRGFSKSTRAWGDMTSVLADAIPGVRVVKAFAQEHREIDRFGDANKLVVRANDRVNRIWSFFGPMVTLLTDFGVLIIWACAVWMIFKGQVTVGVLTAFLAYIGRFYARMESMIRTVSAFERTAASAKRIFDVLDVEPRVAEAANAIEPGKLRGKIEFREVSFSYGKRDILHGVNLTVRPGEMVGFVGPSGSGKSTLLNLVCRFYDVCQGAVLADDIDVRDLTISGYRKNIGIVLQEPFLFYGTIAENIAYGKPDASREEIINAARTACAHDFVICLPDGYDTLVGERGQLLSGGERQRISIARAILINPAILILDEATSAVDVETEKEIQQAVENLVQGRTTLAVAHRLSTLKRADRIVVLEAGAISAVGQHAELLATSPTYARFHRTNAEIYGITSGMKETEQEETSASPVERYADF